MLAALLAASLVFTKPAHARDFTVTNTNDSGAGSLRQAILDANANRGADTIGFDIPGSGVRTVAPFSELPAITGPVTIDGYTQPGARPNSRQSGALDAIILVEISGIDANPADGLTITASNVVVRGLAINRFSGRGVDVGSGNGARIEGNFIGTDASGTLDRGNGSFGVGLDGGGKHTTGGTSPDKRNLISGNNGLAVEISSNGTGGNKVQGNLIGVQKDGTSFLGGSAAGLFVDTPDNTIGGTEPGAANVIANSFGDGVDVFGDGNTGNRILSNSIFGNGDLGIDLGDNGRTGNDPRDADNGPNNLQNFPALASADKFSGGKTVIQGTLDSIPSKGKKKKSLTLQLFANPQGEDEGKTFLGQVTATTDREGKASFTFETTRPLTSGDKITATATDKGGNTSEFSDPETVTLGPGQG